LVNFEDGDISDQEEDDDDDDDDAYDND